MQGGTCSTRTESCHWQVCFLGKILRGVNSRGVVDMSHSSWWSIFPFKYDPSLTLRILIFYQIISFSEIHKWWWNMTHKKSSRLQWNYLKGRSRGNRTKIIKYVIFYLKEGDSFTSPGMATYVMSWKIASLRKFKLRERGRAKGKGKTF